MRLLIYSLLVTALITISCENSTEDNEAPLTYYDDMEGEKEYDLEGARAISWKALTDSTIQDNQVIILEGYIQPLGGFKLVTDKNIYVRMHGIRNNQSSYTVMFPIKVGTGPNTIKMLEDNYSQEDLQITTEDGSIKGVGMPVRLTAGIVQSYDNNGEIDIDLETIKIEKAEDPFDKSILSTAVELTNDVIELTDTTNADYFYMEGNLTNVSSVYGASTCGIYIEQINNDYLKSIQVLHSGTSAPSTINELSPNYTDNDLILRDCEGNEFNLINAKVKVYGRLSESGLLFEVEEIEKLK